MNKTDKKINDYLDRARKLLKEFYKGEKELSELDAVYVFKIAKLIQAQEIHEESFRLKHISPQFDKDGSLKVLYKKLKE